MTAFFGNAVVVISYDMYLLFALLPTRLLDYHSISTRLALATSGIWHIAVRA